MRPTSVYRLQFNREFTFKDALGILDYLKEMGVEGVYCSPYLKAEKGSMHGYDVVSPHHINPEIGTFAEYKAFCGGLKERGMFHYFDLVANHMAATEENPWWYHVLEHGPSSKYAEYFDIHWNPPQEDLKGKLLFPILGDTLDEAIKKGDVREDGQYTYVYDRRLPKSDFYKLEFWQAAYHNVNYRRFFDIYGLAALRIELDHVFDEYHKFLFELIDEGYVDGIRIDHPDGFYDPQGVFHRIKKRYPDLPIVVEKILGHGEHLPDDWEVDGTVGYETLGHLTGIFIDQTSEERLTDIYHKFIDEKIDYQALLDKNKREYALLYLASELDQLTVLSKDKDKGEVVDELAACSVYRTYEREGDAYRMRFQQISPVVMAKGLEDTQLYQYNRLLALNEVGGHPDIFGCSIDEFHALNQYHLEHHPYGFTTGTTHDTKRSEDVRLRLSLLSELADVWEEKVFEWREINQPLNPPDPNMEYFIYQTMLGFWNDDALASLEWRLVEYVVKAARESKAQTNWVNQNENYENELKHFSRAILSHGPFLASFKPFEKMVNALGRLKSLSANVLRLGIPGIFDLYQGTEEWAFYLVDPDNRRAVDYEALLRKKKHPKHTLLKIGLNYRKNHKDLFLHGTYSPLQAKNGVAFIREFEGKKVVVVGKRLMTTPDKVSVLLSNHPRLKSIFTGEEQTVDHELTVQVADIFEIV
ncbi:MAG: Maltooligosyl trehalose synthase [Chlamydiia bacterium]|nr:Maltooligosyl trehalose synthase [Chlamydiia bacterium]MCH9615696.1 Maltooligosyl trehalose synthase [Chlamydiia bacterium]MCH9628901.1 Maltooligosyl trehalose synthase [Chlamydiia bacterium]